MKDVKFEPVLVAKVLIKTKLMKRSCRDIEWDIFFALSSFHTLLSPVGCWEELDRETT